MVTKKNNSGNFGGISTDAVKQATGKHWDEWFEILDKVRASEMTHKEIAKFIHDKYRASGTSGWWAQMITVGYEQARGLREKNQTAGGYSVSVTRSIDVPAETAYAFWMNRRRLTKWLGSDFQISSSAENKSVRGLWSDGKTRVNVGFFSKGEGKCQVAVEHNKLKDAKDVEQKRAFWKEKLAQLKSLLEG